MLEIDPTYYVGIDLATQRDFTAITIVEPSLWLSAQTQRGLHIDLM